MTCSRLCPVVTNSVTGIIGLLLPLPLEENFSSDGILLHLRKKLYVIN